MTTGTLKGGLMAAAAVAALAAGPAFAQDVSACLITKTDTNPFFVKMKEGAQAKADELGMTLKAYAGRVDGDNESQVAAIETCIADGAKGILLVPSDTKAIVDIGEEGARRRDPGDRARHAARTDRRGRRDARHRQLRGRPADRRLGGRDARRRGGGRARRLPRPQSRRSRRSTCCATRASWPGFGIDTKDPNVIGDEDDPRIVGHDVTNGNEEGGRTAMENLLQQDPTINVVHTINEPAAAGAYEALKSVGREGDVLIVSVDGGCPGVQNVVDGVIGATSQQYPLLMASMGIEAIKKYADTGELPAKTEGKDFTDTGVQLDHRQAGGGRRRRSPPQRAMEKCWG